MTPHPFVVLSTKHYERLARHLYKHQPKFGAIQESAVAILERDPTNRSGSYDIKKLANVARGEGQWRIALGRFRIRYDVVEQDVVLHYCGLRREDTY